MVTEFLFLVKLYNVLEYSESEMNTVVSCDHLRCETDATLLE